VKELRFLLAPEVVYFIMSATFGFVYVCMKVCAPVEETKEFNAAEVRRVWH
jgi:hypothetical protein